MHCLVRSSVAFVSSASIPAERFCVSVLAITVQSLYDEIFKMMMHLLSPRFCRRRQLGKYRSYDSQHWLRSSTKK